MTHTLSSVPKTFDWPLAYEAENFIRERIAQFLTRNSFAQKLSERMRDETGTDFFEWVDHLVLNAADEKQLRELGFVPDKVETPNGELVLHHPRATLPRVILDKKVQLSPAAVALKPEFVADFISAHSLTSKIDGDPMSQYRRAVVADEKGSRLEVIERNAYRGFVTGILDGKTAKNIVRARDLWRTRPRFCGTSEAGVQAANVILNESIALVGRDLSCQFFFEEERRYWEGRNRAGQIQKRRQDRLGLGWGNHDHHTFRCSREYFVDVIEFLVKLGFEKRERYYAGSEAGWGAQVSEQPIVGIVVFADVDLMPDETEIDFSSKRLTPAPNLGTVGLWTGLHGESFLQAGMHHLEARFDFDQLRDQLKNEGVNTMKPFSDFQFLRQAFTEGERWAVRPERAAALLRKGLITQEQHDKFLREGALGSHLENLQRRGGFKGFNQKAVSVIISATDPRKNLQHAA